MSLEQTSQRTVLVIGASGTIGSQIIRQFDLDRDDDDRGTSTTVRLATSRQDQLDRWHQQGRDAVILNLDDPETFSPALRGIDGVFLLTGYTAEMLYQSKTLIDACVQARVGHIVHLGVSSSGRDRIPHFAWHDLIETYLKAMAAHGIIAWTNLHPNVILDSLLVTQPSVLETRRFRVMWGEETKLGWVSAYDIAAVAAAVLKQGPTRHSGKDYFLGHEVLTGPEAATILTEALGGPEFTCDVGHPEDLEGYLSTMPQMDAGTRLYMQSAVQTMRQGELGRMGFQAEARDDVETVLGRPALSLKEWAVQHLS